MKPLKLAVPIVMLVAVLATAAIIAPRAYRWYLGLRHPLSPKLPVGSTAWTPPPGSVSMPTKSAADLGAAEPAMTRQEADAKLKNPLPPSAQSIEQGKKHFLVYCATCHGRDGKGGGPVAKRAAFPPPDLTVAAARRSEGFLYSTIRNGGAVMPAQGHALAPQERWQIVHFLKSIARAVPPPTEMVSSTGVGQARGAVEAATDGPAIPARGDAAKGKLVFDDKCSVCHDATSDQEIVGPGLKDLFRWPPHRGPDGGQHATHTTAIIRKQILEGGGAMAPITGLGEQELADLLAYLQTL